MLIENQIVEIKNVSRSNNYKYFLNKGYVPKDNIINVHAKDLPEDSNYKVKITCDFCNNVSLKPYKHAIKEIEHCCKNCIYKKVKRNNLEKYGVENPGQILEVKEKVKQTNLERYGVENAYQIESVRQTTFQNLGVEYPFQSYKIQEKQRQTMIEKYGVEYANQNNEIFNKVKQTNLERYGIELPFLSEKTRQTNLERYGAEYPLQSEEIREKQKRTMMNRYDVEYPFQSEKIRDLATKSMFKTKYENGTIPTSQQQLYLHKLLGGELNYPVDRCSLDIALVDEKIDIEYNGGGHYVWPLINGMSEEEHNRKEMNRYGYLKQRGWKLIRIVSKKDRLYDDKMMTELIERCKKYLLNSEHSWIEINVDEDLIISSKIKEKIEK